MNNGRRTVRARKRKPAVLAGREHDGPSSGLCPHLSSPKLAPLSFINMKAGVHLLV